MILFFLALILFIFGREFLPLASIIKLHQYFITIESSIHEVLPLDQDIKAQRLDLNESSVVELCILFENTFKYISSLEKLLNLFLIRDMLFKDCFFVILFLAFRILHDLVKKIVLFAAFLGHLFFLVLLSPLALPKDSVR